MKFGKEFKKQMVPEWTEAYVDYNGLKRILREFLQYKQNQEASTPLRALHRKLSLPRPFRELSLHNADDLSSEGDIEDQVIDVANTLSPQDGSRRHYKIEFLKQSEEGGEVEVKFFKKLDNQLNKANTFYKEKVQEMIHEACTLNKQMDALIALRIKVGKSPNNSQTNSLPHHVTANPLKNVKENETQSSEGQDLESSGEVTEFDQEKQEASASPREEKLGDSEQDSLSVLERVKINNTLDSPLSTIKGVFKDSREEDLSFNKQELKKVEERLRAVFIEFYQKLRLLKHYSHMNLTAFSKILKKYEKITTGRAARSYMRIVDEAALSSSDEVGNLLERVESIFIRHFSNANRREGMKSLRPTVKREKHRVTFFSGFFCGCTVALLVAVVLRIQAQKQMDTAEGSSYIVNIFPLYSVFGYVILHMLLYAANIYFWRRYRVNYPFIFGFKQGTELGYREVFFISNGLAVLTFGSFLANLHMNMGSKASNYKRVTELLPLGLVTVVLIILFCPFDIIYRSSRFFFIRCLIRCIFSPLYKVRLPDFFLADNLTSQIQAIRCLVLYICYYGLGEYTRRQYKCRSHGIYNALYFVVAVIPYWLRFLQCVRRLCEEKEAVHGYNGLKYFLTIVAVLIRTAFEVNKTRTWMILAWISSTIAVMMNIYWDIVVDWGLLRRKSRNPFLRDKLVISHKSVYFAAMLLNILLRLAWLQLVLEFNLQDLRKMAATTIIACLEIVRRGVWSFFRLENEHLNNVGKYRAFKSVPLPFNYYDPDEDKDD